MGLLRAGLLMAEVSRQRKAAALGKGLLAWTYRLHSICFPCFERATVSSHSHGGKGQRVSTYIISSPRTYAGLSSEKLKSGYRTPKSQF